MKIIDKIKLLFAKKDNTNSVWKEIVVAKIVKSEKHPNADRLKICQVDCGSETRTIVCGGSNVSDNILVAVAKPGVKVYLGGKDELVELKPVVIRGIESKGMICGADELKLAERFPMKDEKEILDLTKYNFSVGMKLSDALNSIK